MKLLHNLDKILSLHHVTLCYIIVTDSRAIDIAENKFAIFPFPRNNVFLIVCSLHVNFFYS